MKNYVSFHMHSDYSLLDSCTKFQEYVDLASKNGQAAIASTEHGKPLGWVSKKMYCDSVGVRFIHGVEIYLTESLDEKVRDNYHTILLAKNLDGVRELNRLVSKSCRKDHFFYVNRISFDEFLEISDNIISTSACLASPLNKLPESHPRYKELAGKYTFFEIQPHDHPAQIAFNQKLFRLSEEFGTRLIVGTDTHSSTAYKAECRSVLMSAKNKSYGDEDKFDLTYKTYDELCDMFALQNAIPEEAWMGAVENTNLLLNMTEDFELDKSIKYPVLYGDRKSDSERFSATVESKFRDKLSRGIIPKEQEAAFRSAIDEEMRVFEKLHMDGFMLSMSELVSWCKENNMAIGTARGSVGGSRVAYVTDITDLNPETWHTVFSRFCNEDREEVGDIDIDCVEEDRDKIFKHIIGRFGEDKTARVAAFGTIQSKGVIDDVGRHLARKWSEAHGNSASNPWSLPAIASIKSAFDINPEQTKEKYKELFYYYDGLIDTKISQSVHPAGMIISPITLDDNYGTFDKDGETCLMLDMDEAHEVGLVKYDFLVMKTVQVIRDTCRYLGKSYPKTNEINWEDQAVWNDMISSPVAIFQFEGDYAFNSLRKFKPKNIFEMALVAASIRPSGASYRDSLLARIPHKNPSEIIDKLLENNLGYLVYQEDTIRFLQEICGLTGGQADNVRRAIGRKQRDRLEEALPAILNGYCKRSDKPRNVAQKEAEEFLRIIEDSADYQFGYNHAIAYCLLGYMCAYYRYYYPLEFITSFLNNAANEDDVRNGTSFAQKHLGIKVTMPKWGHSKGDYFFEKKNNLISKGLSSIKYLGSSVAEELYSLANLKKYDRFVDVLSAINERTSLNSRQLDILIKIDFFSEFGNQRELLYIADMFSNTFRKGEAKQIRRAAVDGTNLEPIIRKYSIGATASGGIAKSYTLLDVKSVMEEVEDEIKKSKMRDLDDTTKVKNFYDALGYVGYISGKEEDRRKLYVMDMKPLYRKRDRKLFGYSVFTKSIGSGKESRFTAFKELVAKEPIKKGDVIYCRQFDVDGEYFRLVSYKKL